MCAHLLAAQKIYNAPACMGCMSIHLYLFIPADSAEIGLQANDHGDNLPREYMY